MAMFHIRKFRSVKIFKEKKMKRKYLLITILSLLIIAALFVACAPATAPAEAAPAEEEVAAEPEKGPILIGMDMPVTGNDAVEGLNILHGAELYIEEINSAGGILGHQIKLVIADNVCDSAVGISALRKVIEVDKVHATMGSVCSSVTLAVMPILEETKTLSLDVASTNKTITELAGPAGGNIWKFRLNLSDILLDTAFSKYIDQNSSRVAAMVTNTDFGRSSLENFQNILGDKIIATEYFEYGDADFRPALTRIKQLNPDSILIFAGYPESTKLVAQMYELGMDLQIYGRGTVVGPEAISLTPEEAMPLFEGAMQVSTWSANPEASDFIDKWMKKYGEGPGQDNGMGYYGMQVLIEGIKNCGKITGDLQVDRACIRDGLSKVDIEIAGLGHVKFDDHNQAHFPMFVNVVENGKVVVKERIASE